jgi:hypothetical protein
MARLLKPTAIKIIIFLSPIIYQIVFWLVVRVKVGLSLENIIGVAVIVWTILGFPGLIICSIMPYCTSLHGDVISTNRYLFYLSSMIAFGIWYLLSVVLGEIFTPIYKRVVGLAMNRFRIKRVFIIVVLMVFLIIGFYFIAYYSDRAFWYQNSGGKNVSVEKWECINGFLNVKLINVGFEDINFSEVPIYVDDSLISCNWQGSLKVNSTATCVSRKRLGSRTKQIPSRYDVKVKTPTGSTSTAVLCE